MEARMVGHDRVRRDDRGIGETGPDREPGEVVAKRPIDVQPAPFCSCMAAVAVKIFEMEPAR